MSLSKHSNLNTKLLPFNIMDLRDENFYDFIRQFAGKKAGELLSFQECNSVDSLLGCIDVTTILHLESDELIDLKKEHVHYIE
ncbi:unnamed protein product [Rotaria socialis]|uniref:Uncharacterized protein n=1 Tax=Rotaria socialis TaxID=392032 RepID=A0A821MJA4_9BILA|nr:unnamed protein product [Rotaria socialis]